MRTLLTLLFYLITIPIAAVFEFPWTFISGKIDLLYRTGVWIAWTGVRICGIRAKAVGVEKLDPRGTYMYMSNHASNLDPPILTRMLPGRASVLVKKELFSIPLLGRAMRMASLVPVDRSNRENAIASLRAAVDVLQSGLSMTVFVEGTRSRDGRLLPFKKGPFYLAMETGTPIVPVTLVGTHQLLPKGKFFARSGEVTVIFHEPIDPRRYTSRDDLIAAVRERIASGLPLTS